MKKQSGFTLIELVIVVVILGFLAVTAIPRFVDLTVQAKKANIEGMAGGFATGISLARAQWEAEGRQKDASSNNFTVYDGTTVYLTVRNDGNGIRPGYIIGTTATSTISNVDCVVVWNSILQQPPQITDVLATLNGSDVYDYYAIKSTADTNDPICSYYLKETIAQDGSGNYLTTNIDNVANYFTYKPANSEVAVIIKQQ